MNMNENITTAALDKKGKEFSQKNDKYVMVIDDEGRKSPAIDTLCDILSDQGYEVTVKTDPKEVINLTEEELTKYPVFIIDYDMPVYADKLIPDIKEKNLFAYIIVYTAFPKQESQEKFDTLKKLNIIGVDYWAEKADMDTFKELLHRVDYAFRRIKNIYSPLHIYG